MKNVFIILLVTGCLMACQKDNDENQTDGKKQVTQQQIDNNTIILSSEDIQTDVPFATVRSMVHHNNRLYMSELSDQDSLVKILDLPEQRIIGHLIQKGNGPNELSFADALSVRRGYFFLTDPYEFKIYRQPIDAGQHIKWGETGLETIRLEAVFADEIIPTEDAIFTTYYAAEEVARFAKMDASGKLQAYMGALPPHPDSATIDERIYNMIFTAKSAIKPDGERFALAYEYEDRIEIYDKASNLLHIVKGPDFYHPEFDINERKNGVVKVRDKTRKACIKLRATSNEIWTLYSGEIVYPGNEDLNELTYKNNKMLVFDWEGNFLRAYKLDIPIYNFCLDSENKVIYAVTEENDNHIISFEYN